jgi:hypothetical protein
MPSAVNSATGIRCRPKNDMPLVTSSKVPRAHWNFGCAVAKPRAPSRASQIAIAPA